jgi:hypothetical protein
MPVIVDPIIQTKLSQPVNAIYIKAFHKMIKLPELIEPSKLGVSCLKKDVKMICPAVSGLFAKSRMPFKNYRRIIFSDDFPEHSPFPYGFATRSFPLHT